MSRRSVCAVALGVFALSLGPPARGGEKPALEGFTPLFNGKDLSGLKATGNPKVWGVEDGLLYVSGGGGGWLLTEKEYGDFELYLEYRMPKMGNSGVALRTPPKGDPAYVGMEIQLLDDANWKGLRPVQQTGSIYDVVPAAKIVSRPHGEWNQMHITARGRHVKIVHNGETLVDADLDDYVKEHGERHPGLKRDRGHVGLQSYNYRVDFRNFMIKPLD